VFQGYEDNTSTSNPNKQYNLVITGIHKTDLYAKKIYDEHIFPVTKFLSKISLLTITVNILTIGLRINGLFFISHPNFLPNPLW